MNRTLQSLLEELRALDESSTIEAKLGTQVDRSVMETICAFSNEPGLGGGYLLLGVARSPQADLFAPPYEVVGVDDPDKLQSDLASQCTNLFNRPIRPQVTVERQGDKRVLIVFVPELAPSDKPLFIKSLQLPRGAFRRVGSSDVEGTEDDIIALVQGHDAESHDASVVADADVNDFDPVAIRAYRELRAQVNPNAEELAWSDSDLLRALGALSIEHTHPRPTVAGLLLFGTSMALRRCFPMMRVDYVRLPGKEWVQDPDRRFDTVEIRAPLVIAVRRAIATVRDDLPASFSLPEGAAIRTDETVLPMRVLREAIVNAVMHRSYRIHGAIQILRYANRIEIRNPGHSLKAEDQLGEPGSQTRNPRIAAVMHDLNLAETKGSGIRVMRELMTQHDLLPPTFESTRRPDQFVATFLFHHFLEASDLAWLRRLTLERLSDEEARALVFVREVGAIDNASYRSINQADTLNASTHLRRLRDLGLLEMKGSGSRTYYAPGPVMQAAERRVVPSDSPGLQTHKLDPQTHKLDPQTHKLDPQTHKLGPQTHKLSEVEPALPEALRRRLPQPGQRPKEAELRDLIVELCAIEPRSARELADLLSRRDARDLARSHLRPLVEAGRLAYTVGAMPNHPDQRYTVPSP